MGFAFLREERAALVGGDPRKFHMPSASDLRFNWVHADLAALDRRGPRDRGRRVAHGRPAEGLPRVRPSSIRRPMTAPDQAARAPRRQCGGGS